MGIEMVDFAGRTYDPGMVPEVVEVREDQGLPDGLAVIDETIAPTVTWHGQVVNPDKLREAFFRRPQERLRWLNDQDG